MKQTLTSVRDENSILITAEFLESGAILKVGEKTTRRYEIDLIVKNDITANQLLIAIQEGLRSKLLRKYHFDVAKDDTRIVYRDNRHPEAETQDDEALSDREEAEALKRVFGKSGANKGIGFWGRAKSRRYLRKKKKLSEAARALDAEAEQDDSRIPVKSDAEKEEEQRNCYIVCWNVFNECFEEYKRAVPDKDAPDELDMIRFGTPREPVIGLGSVNYRKIKDGVRLFESDSFKVCLSREYGNLTLAELGFITTTRVVFDPIGWHHSAALFDPTKVIEAFRDTVPLYNISERPLKKLDDEPVHIIPPQEAPVKPKMNLTTMILTPLLMMGMMMGVQLFGGFGNNNFGFMTMGVMTGGMSLISLVTALVNVRIRNREYRKTIREWRVHYQDYIRGLLDDIQRKQAEDVSKLRLIYPAARGDGTDPGKDLTTKAQELNGDIFTRSADHPDFLSVRIGTSVEGSELVPSVFAIDGEKRESVFESVRYQNIRNESGFPFTILMEGESPQNNSDGSQGYLIHLPSDIANAYASLAGAPVMLSLRDARCVGVVFDKPCTFYPFLSNMLLDLCFYHSPDDLQCILFCEETDDRIEQQEIIRRFKHLPHFHELLGDVSAFAFNKDDAYLILNRLLEILSQRRTAKDEAHYPHVVMFVLNEYNLKRHPVAEYLPEFGEDKKNECGISFIFCKRYTEELPKYCEKIVRRETVDGEDRWSLLPHTQTVSRASGSGDTDVNRYGFEADAFPPEHRDMGISTDNDQYYRAFKSISALYYERIAQGADVPGKVELFDLIINDSKSESIEALAGDLQKFVRRSWGLEQGTAPKDITRMLSVPIGMKESGVIELDLHEKADGPHMLVAGTTGSGKTETILTFLAALCASYSPEQVNLLLMDMKGAGFVQRIGDEERGTRLPHVVGTVTDITDDESGTGMGYMLRRFLDSMNAEIKRRKVLLKKMGVESVDSYYNARADLESYADAHPGLNLDELRQLPPLPHLFVVIDEFTELMRFSADNGDVDFRVAITSLARIGRSLGFHIILISQNIENAITSDIRVNSRARICLRVATRDASKEMIGTDLAASPLMPYNGRAYLLVDNGYRFEYFQSGYSGADVTRNLKNPVVITHAEMSGQYSLFYSAEDDAEKAEAVKEKDEDIPEADERTDNTAAAGKPAEEQPVNQTVHTASFQMSDESETEIPVPQGDIVRVEPDEPETDGFRAPVTEEDTEEVLVPEKEYASVKTDAQAHPFPQSRQFGVQRQVTPNPVENEKKKTGTTQLELLVEQIRLCFKESGMEQPHCVFAPSLPNACYFEYDWNSRRGEVRTLKETQNGGKAE